MQSDSVNNPINIILVDDHDLVRAGIKYMLEDEPDIRVIGEARTGEDAVKLGRKLNPHVILMDLKMPGIGGILATQKLLRSNPEIKILVVTVLASTIYSNYLLQIGAAGYLTKGATTREIVEAIRAVHAGQQYISPNLQEKLLKEETAHDSNAVSPFSALSEDSMAMVLMIVSGASVQDIADTLKMSTKAVYEVRRSIFEQLKIDDDVALTLLALRHGLIDVKDLNS